MLIRKYSMGLFRGLPIKQWMDGEGEGEGEGAATKEGEGEGEGDPEKNGKLWDGKFTPEQQKAIDASFNKRFAKEKAEKEKLVADLKQIKQSKNMTEEEKNTLQGRIDKLEESMMTEQQRAASEKQKLEEKYTKERKNLTEDRDAWRSRFETAILDRALTDAAIDSIAENPEQIRMMFKGGAYLKEDVDDEGKPKGTFSPRLKFVGLDPDMEKDPKKMDLDLPVGEAIAKLRKDGQHKNLFKHEGTPGTGKPPAGGGRGGDPSAPPTLEQFGGDEKKYAKAYQDWRKVYNLDGTKRETK